MDPKLADVVAASLLATMALAPWAWPTTTVRLQAADKVSGNVVRAADARFQLSAGGNSQDVSFASGLCDMEAVTGEK